MAIPKGEATDAGPTRRVTGDPAAWLCRRKSEDQGVLKAQCILSKNHLTLDYTVECRLQERSECDADWLSCEKDWPHR